MEQKNKIMIVDDNPIDQLITAHVLKMSYAHENILVMESAPAALEYLDANQHNLSAMPSLILLDLDMPGMNGFGFLDKFSTFTTAVKEACKIVVLTASDVMADIEMMQADPNVIKLITKPLTKTALMPMI